MIEENRISRAKILIHHEKYSEAEKLLKELLTTDATNMAYLSLLAEVYLQQDQLDKAKQIIDNTIGIAPDAAELFFIRARIFIKKEEYDEAEKDINQSIALYPYETNYFALLANVKLIRKKYKEALDLANKALKIDAENLLGLNIRSTALLKLNKSEDSFKTIEDALREDPNNPYTHANYGMGLLENGQHKKALVHFKESLKNDPNYAFAQAGMMEALKATNPVYGLFLKYAFWIGNLTSKYQWGVIIGFYLFYRLINTVARNNETLQPFLYPLLIILALVAFSTWVIEPISNLFLRFNSYGQLLLSKNEKLSSNFVAASFVLFLVGIALYAIFGGDRYLAIGVFGFMMMVPLSLMFSQSKQKNAFLIYAISMAVIGASAIGITFIRDELFNSLTLVFIIGFVGFQWVANFLLIKEDNK